MYLELERVEGADCRKLISVKFEYVYMFVCTIWNAAHAQFGLSWRRG